MPVTRTSLRGGRAGRRGEHVLGKPVVLGEPFLHLPLDSLAARPS